MITPAKTINFDKTETNNDGVFDKTETNADLKNKCLAPSNLHTFFLPQKIATKFAAKIQSFFSI